MPLLDPTPQDNTVKSNPWYLNGPQSNTPQSNAPWWKTCRLFVDHPIVARCLAAAHAAARRGCWILDAPSTGYRHPDNDFSTTASVS
jgi:hypothetical protein